VSTALSCCSPRSLGRTAALPSSFQADCFVNNTIVTCQPLKHASFAREAFEETPAGAVLNDAGPPGDYRIFRINARGSCSSDRAALSSAVWTPGYYGREPVSIAAARARETRQGPAGRPFEQSRDPAWGSYGRAQIGAGTRPILGTSLTTCRTTFGIPASLGWALFWTCPRRTPWRSLRRSFRGHGRPISSASKPRRSSRASSPENAKQASDYSLRAKRSKSGPSALTSSVQRERQSCSCLAHDRHLGATWVPALSISPLCWRVLRGTGSPRIGRAPCTMHIGVSTIRYRQLSTVHWTPAISHGVA
jgi:hypothetical protein